MTVMNSFCVFESFWQKKMLFMGVFCIVKTCVPPVSQTFSEPLSLRHHR